LCLTFLEYEALSFKLWDFKVKAWKLRENLKFSIKKLSIFVNFENFIDFSKIQKFVTFSKNLNIKSSLLFQKVQNSKVR